MNRQSISKSCDVDVSDITLLGDPTSRDEETVRLSALRMLQDNPLMSQRQMSRALGISLGKTNYVLHALLAKGLVKVQNFRRSDNKLAYAYLLTPSGISQKASLTKSFLGRKEAEFDALKRTIAVLRREIDNSALGARNVRK